MARSQKLTEALSRCVINYPFYAVLLFDLLTIKEGTAEELGGVPTAATDGKYLYVNTEWFGNLDIEERCFVLCHEIMHVVLDHCGRNKAYIERGIGPDFKPWNPRKWNHATDYIINDWITKSGLNAMPQGGLHNPRWGMNEIADEVYEKLKDEDMPPPNGGDGSDGDGWDTHMPGNAGGTPTKADVQRAMAQAAATAKAQGKMPGNLKRLVDEICDPQVDWTEQLRLAVTTSAGKDEATWARPNRRRLAVTPQVIMPGTTGVQAGKVVVYGDTSGSISDKEWSHFFGEVGSISAELNPEELWLGSCDMVAYDPHLIEDMSDVESYVPEGGGGTHMPAIFEKLEELDIVPDCLIILTDGYTDYGEHPGYDVVWAMTTDQLAPFGVNVRIHVTGV